eukprot:1864629-Rhodomonas_salina.1
MCIRDSRYRHKNRNKDSGAEVTPSEQRFQELLCHPTSVLLRQKDSKEAQPSKRPSLSEDRTSPSARSSTDSAAHLRPAVAQPHEPAEEECVRESGRRGKEEGAYTPASSAWTLPGGLVTVRLRRCMHRWQNFWILRFASF